MSWIVKCNDCKYREEFDTLWDAEEERQEHEVKNDHDTDIEEEK